MRFDYNVKYVPGKELVSADSLSKNSSLLEKETTEEFKIETTEYVKYSVDALPASRSLLDRVQTAKENNDVCKKLRKLCL